MNVIMANLDNFTTPISLSHCVVYNLCSCCFIRYLFSNTSSAFSQLDCIALLEKLIVRMLLTLSVLKDSSKSWTKKLKPVIQNARSASLSLYIMRVFAQIRKRQTSCASLSYAFHVDSLNRKLESKKTGFHPKQTFYCIEFLLVNTVYERTK